MNDARTVDLRVSIKTPRKRVWLAKTYIQPSIDNKMLMMKFESQPVLRKTARGGRNSARK